MKSPFWTLLGISAWILLSPWILGFASINLALWGNLLGGFVLLIFAFRFFVFDKK
jgi:hypothetical protein